MEKEHKTTKVYLDSINEFDKCNELKNELWAVNPFAKELVFKIKYRMVENINEMLSPLLGYSNRINNDAETLAYLNPKAYKKFLKEVIKSYEELSNNLHKTVLEECKKLKANETQTGSTPND